MTVKANSHFVDADIQGTSGLDDWQSFNFEFPPSDPAKIGIRTAGDLQKIGVDAAFPADGNYEVLNDINCSGISEWSPIGETTSEEGVNFSGSFDGRYFTISNINIVHTGSGWNESGLFGLVGGVNDVIRRVIVTNVNHTADAGVTIRHAGLLIGNYSPSAAFVTLEDCYAQGTITGTGTSPLRTCGGLIGTCGINRGIFRRCGVDIVMTKTPNVFPYNQTNTFELGGLVGRLTGIISPFLTVQDCYAIGKIN